MESIEDVDVSSLSYEERIKHKSWKIRLDSWEDLCKLFHRCSDPEDSDFANHSHLLKIGLEDVNSSVQEKTLEALELVLNRSDQAKQ
jgi:hypothetical protein